MFDKSVAIGSTRQPSSPAEAWRGTASSAQLSPNRRLTRQQRTEQERLDRYGRFGRR